MNWNQRRIYLLGALVVGIAVFALFAYVEAFGQREGKPGREMEMKHPFPPPCRNRMPPAMAQDLGLTDEQIKSIRDADFTFKERHIELRAQLDQLHLQMEKAFSSDTVDEATVRDVAHRIADLQGKMFILDIDSRLAMERLLTSDQRKRLKQPQIGDRPQGMGPPKGFGGRGPSRPN